MDEIRIGQLIEAMTLDEKASLTAGASLWYLPPVDASASRRSRCPTGPRGYAATV